MPMIRLGSAATIAAIIAARKDVDASSDSDDSKSLSYDTDSSTLESDSSDADDCDNPDKYVVTPRRQQVGYGLRKIKNRVSLSGAHSTLWRTRPIRRPIREVVMVVKAPGQKIGNIMVGYRR